MADIDLFSAGNWKGGGREGGREEGWILVGYRQQLHHSLYLHTHTHTQAHPHGITLPFISDLTSLSSLLLTAEVSVWDTEVTSRSCFCLSMLCFSLNSLSNFCSEERVKAILC